MCMIILPRGKKNYEISESLSEKNRFKRKKKKLENEKLMMQNRVEPDKLVIIYRF